MAHLFTQTFIEHLIGDLGLDSGDTATYRSQSLPLEGLQSVQETDIKKEKKKTHTKKSKFTHCDKCFVAKITVKKKRSIP